MLTRRKNAVLGPLRTLLDAGTVGQMTDGQLLERFALGGEAAEFAFAALVERHGPLVLQTCRSILRDEHAAEDAFQATFLVLVRKGRALWVRDSLGPWLHQVAFRAARSSRSASLRRLAHERQRAETDSVRHGEMTGSDDGAELEAALHEAIARMPARFRVPILLCDLEGRTHEQAARHLGCPVGTVKSRLARGRRRLRDHLTRRGLAPPTGLLLGVALSRPASAALGASRVELVVRAALQLNAGQPLDSIVTAAVLALMKCVTWELSMERMTYALVVFVMLGSLAAGGAGLVRAGFSDPPPAAVPAQEEPARATPPLPREHAELLGSWQVIYSSGTVQGQRKGYFLPDATVQFTDRTIVLPSLTDDPANPLRTLDAMPFTLRPGLKDIDEQVKAAEDQLKGFQRRLAEVERASQAKDAPERPLVLARRHVAYGEAMLKKALTERMVRRKETRARESWIDIKAPNGTVWRGIYLNRLDLLTICYDESGSERPGAFVDARPWERLLILRPGSGSLSPASILKPTGIDD